MCRNMFRVCSCVCVCWVLVYACTVVRVGLCECDGTNCKNECLAPLPPNGISWVPSKSRTCLLPLLMLSTSEGYMCLLVCWWFSRCGFGYFGGRCLVTRCRSSLLEITVYLLRCLFCCFIKFSLFSPHLVPVFFSLSLL